MLVMPSNNTGFECGFIAGSFPGRLGHLHNCDATTTPRTGVTWALDNGVFGAWSAGREWSEEPFFSFLEKNAHLTPSWVVCPDWVADKDLTLQRWEQYYPAVSAFGFPVAFVVQDGMKPADVPPEAAMIFVGGSTSWKWQSLRTWTENFPRVHVGRVNTYKLLWMAHEAGAESCDGTGWFRGDRVQLRGLVKYLEESETGIKPQTEFKI